MFHLCKSVAKYPITLFQSMALPGATMNRYGIVILAGGYTANAGQRALVLREAKAAGLVLAPSDDPDTGLVWHQP
jgi:hypothetical protein